MSHEAAKTGMRLTEVPASEIQELIYGNEIDEEMAVTFQYMTDLNRAHVVMLEKQGIIKKKAAVALLKALADIEAAGVEGLELDPAREGTYYNYEHAVIVRTSPEIGGQMHTGRSRNDLGATITRMTYRDTIIRLINAANNLRAAILERAHEHAGTIMPGYTHLQPAQPITLGHYLTAVEAGLARDTGRLLNALEHTNYCPLGAAALAGTGFPIDREMTAELLGFAEPVTNTLDAVASRDYILEAMAAASIMGVTLSRLAQDLFVWYSDEFSMISFRDRVAGTSSIMPQKKNPILQEYIKGRTSQQVGAFASAVAAIHNANYTNVIDANTQAFRSTPKAFHDLFAALVFSRLLIQNLIVKKEIMLERCRGNFTTVTQLADTLVTEWDISFRQAHEVVGAVVRYATEHGMRATDISAELVIEQAAEALGTKYTISTELVKQALDPEKHVELRKHTGGTAKKEVLRMASLGDRKLEADVTAVSLAEQGISRALRDLRKKADELCGK
jgi:argininosuccinate lyase